MRHSLIGLMLASLVLAQNKACAQQKADSIFLKSRGSWIIPVPRFTKVLNYDSVKYRRGCPVGMEVRFSTDSSYEVKAVFDGTIESVILIHDSLCGIITKFGNYCITYGMLVNPTIKKGDSIKKGQVIGRLSSAYDDTYELEILLYDWKKGKEMDPYSWFNWNINHT